MKSYERNRILVDQCTGCGGLFLDKGELEQLAAAETAWHTAQAAPPAPAQRTSYDDRSRDDRSRDDRSRDDRPRYDDRDRDRDRDRDYKPPKKKSSFLTDLFEG
ncbi:MAG: zf-TFIIB domain-containing protein [Chloroflexota bacterium]|nr:zf-TFIIB domain-containing protein [Chloroflexota bacterium]